jgi:hypothetical protein
VCDAHSPEITRHVLASDHAALSPYVVDEQGRPAIDARLLRCGKGRRRARARLVRPPMKGAASRPLARTQAREEAAAAPMRLRLWLWLVVHLLPWRRPCRTPRPTVARSIHP